MLDVAGTDNDGGGSVLATMGATFEVGIVLISFFAVMSNIAANESAITRAVDTGIRTRRPALRRGEVTATALCSRPNGNGLGCERRIAATSAIRLQQAAQLARCNSALFLAAGSRVPSKYAARTSSPGHPELQSFICDAPTLLAEMSLS